MFCPGTVKIKSQIRKWCYLQEPIDSDDKTDVFRRQSHSVKHHDHCNESGLRYSRRPDGRRRGGNADCDQIADAQIYVPDLRYEYSGDGFVQGRTVHVDGGTYRQAKSGYPRIDPYVVLEALYCDR